MPELPEVETLAAGLSRLVVGQHIGDVAVLWDRAVCGCEIVGFKEVLTGRTVLSVGRRGKFLVLSLDEGWYLLIHLRMSGRVRVEAAEADLDPYARVVMTLQDGRRLVLSDPRKFGRVYLTRDPHQVTGSLGPEPLSPSFDLPAFCGLLEGRSGPLKPMLLDQSFLAGLGNIYTDEALFAAGLHPLRKVVSLKPPEVQRLYEAIRTVLTEAVARRGTTLSDGRYMDAEGQPGNNGDFLCVYQREGLPCLRCGRAIERSVVGGRGTRYCPSCQPPQVHSVIA